MKTASLIALIMVTTSIANAQNRKKEQFKLLKPDYIKIGLTTYEFADWAKSIHAWSPLNIMGGAREQGDTTKIKYETYYVISDHKTVNNIYYTTEYKYYFDKEKVIAMTIDPSPFEVFDKDILVDHDFVRESKIPEEGKTIYEFISKRDNYSLLITELVIDTHFEKKMVHKVSVWPKERI